jgi:hypothetical protein
MIVLRRQGCASIGRCVPALSAVRVDAAGQADVELDDVGVEEERVPKA